MTMNPVAVGRPDVAEDAAARAETLIALGRCREALVCIARGLIVAPADNRLHCHEAVARYRLGQYREAARSAGDAICADPGDPWAYDLKALALAAQARSRLPPGRRQLGRQARHAARRAVQLAPGEAWCHCTAAAAELLAGDRAAAHAAARQALALAPDRPEPYVALAQVALAAGDFAAARTAALQGLSVDPTNYSAATQLGTALAGRGRWKQAAVAYAAAARLDPEALPARRNLARLGLAVVAVATLIVMALLCVLAPVGVVLSLLASVSATVTIGLSARLRRRLGRVGLVVALGLARLNVPGWALCHRFDHRALVLDIAATTTIRVTRPGRQMARRAVEGPVVSIRLGELIRTGTSTARSSPRRRRWPRPRWWGAGRSCCS